MLLPLTGGNAQSVAKSLKQAGELALFDFDNPNVSLVPKDTRGTPDGASAAVQSATKQNVPDLLAYYKSANAVAPASVVCGMTMTNSSPP